MTKFRAILAGMVIGVLAFTVGVWAQTALTSISLTGNEVMVAAIGGPGGPSLFIPVAELRNATGYQTTALASGTITITTNTARLVTTAQVTGALTVNAPATPWDGEMFELANASGSNNTATVTFTAAAGQTVTGGGIATQTASTSNEWMYVLSTTTWIKIR